MQYTHPLKQVMGPSKCEVSETQTHHFISPTKVIVSTKVSNSGFTFSDCFFPLYIFNIEQVYDKKKNKLSIEVKKYLRVNFVKSVMFFQK